MENGQQLLETVFTKLNELNLGTEPLRLFPNGLESFNLEVSTEAGKDVLRLEIKANGTIKTNGVSVESAEQDSDHFSVQFNAEGHKVIALIAQKDLETNAPEINTKFQQILIDGDRLITEAATFPDDIRMKQPGTRTYHFIDIPYQDGGPANPPLPAEPHVLSKMAEFSDLLKSGSGDAQSKVDTLSWIIHLIGDVHQPLHCIDHISDLHPGGDKGGNGFKLKGKAKNLHAAWDSSVNVTNAGLGNEELAGNIMAEHSRESLAADLQVTDTEKWARSSFQLARKNAYSITENPSAPPKLSAAYLKKMEKIGHKQAALAGYRLADRLKEILA